MTIVCYSSTRFIDICNFYLLKLHMFNTFNFLCNNKYNFIFSRNFFGSGWRKQKTIFQRSIRFISIILYVFLLTYVYSRELQQIKKTIRFFSK